MADETKNADAMKLETAAADLKPTQAQDLEDKSSRSPRTHMPTDSMVTVPLSETDGASNEDEEGSRVSIVQPDIVVGQPLRTSSRTNSSEIRKAFGKRGSDGSIEAATTDSPTVSVHDTDAPVSPKTEARRGRSNSTGSGSGSSEQVDWAELEKKEEQEPASEEEVSSSLYSDIGGVADANYNRPWHCSLHASSRKMMPFSQTPRLA
ncbi:hypothetical protein J1614_001433 [Plenodomus biglobosus]|nr:hypothetical protein J1614_001433 [Plenodomus biglobosus]